MSLYSLCLEYLNCPAKNLLSRVNRYYALFNIQLLRDTKSSNSILHLAAHPAEELYTVHTIPTL
jgi:hypothetical protein